MTRPVFTLIAFTVTAFALVLNAIPAAPATQPATAPTTQPATPAQLRALADKLDVPPAKPPRPRVYGDLTTALYPVPAEQGEATRHLLYGQTVNRTSVYPIKFVYATEYEKWIDDGIPVVINDERAQFSFGDADSAKEFIAVCDRMTQILVDAKAKCPHTPMTWAYVNPDAVAPHWGAEAVRARQRIIGQCDFVFVWLGHPLDHANWRKNLTLYSDLAHENAPGLPQVFHVDVVAQPSLRQLDEQLRACLEHPRSSGVIAWTAGGQPVKAYQPGYVQTAQKYAERFNGDGLLVKGGPR